MPTTDLERAADWVRSCCRPMREDPWKLEPVLDRIGSASVVLIGEATHGTKEFYRLRAQLTERLIADYGFTAVAVEADWPDAYRVNRYVQGRSGDASAGEALNDFRRFPRWLWRNREVVTFVQWLKTHNDRLPERDRIGWYGLDLYSLHASIEAVLSYLARTDPEAAREARIRYGRFDHFGEDVQGYGYSAGFGLSKSCEEEVVAQLQDLRGRADAHVARDGYVAEDEFFFAEQNARLVRNAEAYYRTMFQGRVSSWNMRDRHMGETLDALMTHLRRDGGTAKIVVWEHNSHLGDARATQMASEGELNVGQLVRERYGTEARLIGFTTYDGSVTAASHWDGPAERKSIRPALEESYESLFHRAGVPRFFLDLHTDEAEQALSVPRLERAIGVLYLPESERLSHYFYASLPRQFDAVMHLDRTEAVEPLDHSPSGV